MNNEPDDQINNERSVFDWTKLILPGAIIIAGVMISAAVILSNGGFGLLGGLKAGSGFGRSAADIGDSLGQEEQKAISTDDDAYLGKKNAPIVMIEFSDYQCPFCRSFWRDTLPLIKSEYIDTGKVRFVYRDFPLNFHPSAIPSAMAAECADDQGKYWEMHDKIFSEQDKLGSGTVQFSIDDLRNWAGQIGLDQGKFNSCLDSQKYAEEIGKDYDDGQAAGVSGTPGFFINGKSVVGAQPFSVFKTIIDELFAKKIVL
ncbi:MAG: hypothetical protein A3J46_01310 [Candidatus Yanofskybacteria bacterium RIFCSPHIGHO2_02_FULL_41_11]|uniref:Thioredoxin domain-containing protein n=1 Tax=Candidatus Yanofskybacteria bacterium RIFCSPHIGHO2_02_FULL_41_11 TaxID=1802675 RepID=A0A1F8F8D5_9BACT|nr:MAG: hypothetical protein A3J46_01310 [Candidatus Yanofskybacteria bacterium RIFCSPHIGHO2_02_FULL_41_11]